MQQSASFERHPFVSMLSLTGLAIVGNLVFGFVGLGIGYLFFDRHNGAGIFSQTVDGLSIQTLKTILLLSSAGTFIVPALIFAGRQNHAGQFLKASRVVPLFAVMLAILVVFVSLPALDLLITLNKAMKLPLFLKPLEEWMRLREDETDALTRRLLEMRSRTDLNVNLLMLAVVPAIGEEFFFRGCLQQIIGRWFKNDHLAIWLTAVIFSAIHVQFFGFLPRMLLGALLGYLFYWGKSIWLPILAHFTNNAISVVGSYIYQQKGLDPVKFENNSSNSPLLSIGSIVLVALVLILFKYAAEPDAVQSTE